ncbi:MULTISPECIES: aminoglycoside phosphotransferase family protein [Amycolatopsis]|uniref:Predicted kinase, aminoglycoside phosphotransferase (APT) family n=2 Tax=Amycolatopsis TaxID=1813 RepID=A0A1I4C8S7_9PSEU|nr:aminoglycoside phosphotransferase family protein [Amycolatopsis sacchari]SFK76471.1 Predicted kinase, aminoglycoside phosphotransferase (APT) family [Amycolatopsis sacchari]
MVAGETHSSARLLDDGSVRELIAAQFPQWAELPVQRFASAGTVNAIYRLGDDMVVRLPLLESGAQDLEREREWLPRLASWLPARIPEVLGAGAPSAGWPWPWVVYRWLPGDHPRPGALSAPVLLAEDLAGFVAAMRRIPLPNAPRAYRGGPLTLLDSATRAAIGRLREIPEERVDCDLVTAVWEEALRAPAPAEPGVWLHADLMPGNLLVEGGRLSAVIDFGCLGRGDPACDLYPAWHLLPAGARRVFREALEVDDATWARGRGRALSQALIALPYYRTTNQVMADSARHVIRTVQEELGR